MNTINISEKRLKSLTHLDLSKYVFHTEGKVFDFNHRGNRKVLKTLYNYKGLLFANKLYTVETLDYYKEYLPESFLCPDNLVSVSSEVQGFTIPYFEGVNLADLLKDKQIDVREKIYYLTKIGEVLKQLKNIRKYSPLNQIYINDLYESNILVNPNNKELKFIDLDSCKILDNCAFHARRLNPNYFLDDKTHKYLYNDQDSNYGYIIANENSDLFCYNIMILNYLYGKNILEMSMDEFFDYLNYLDKLEFDKELLDSFEKLTLSCDNENPYYLLDTISDNQVYRAKKIVYECNKKH